jgi:HEAT repeat protein
MKDRPKQPGGKKRKKRPPPIYVEVTYPSWLGVVSFAWALVGWLIASAAPHLAFVPLVGVLHYVFPAVTVALIGGNLFFAVRDLRRGAHVLRLGVVTGLQVALFTTLFFQLFAHLGAALYDVRGPTSAWQWFQFSLAHAFRAADVLDIVEAFGMRIQPIHHEAALVAVFVILYHTVVDVFFLGLVWEIVTRIRRQLLDDPVIAGLVNRALAITFGVWLVAWVVEACAVHRWRPVDIPLWFLENLLRVVDFADVMESFDLRLHSLPREGLVGTLTFLCRAWIAIGLAMLFTQSKKRVEVRRVVTPPEVNAWAYWLRRAQVLAGILLAVLITGVLAQVVLGNPASSLAARVGERSDDRARSALRALRRMGPTAKESIPALVGARARVRPAVRDEITQTLGYLGEDAIEPLRDVALREEGASAVFAVESLGRIGGESAPELVKVWQAAASGEARERADQELRRLGVEGVQALMAATTPENAAAHLFWFKEVDPNWRLRNSHNRVVQSLQRLPDLIRRLKENPEATEAAKVLAELRGCGSAAKEALPEVLGRLTARDHNVWAQAEALLVAIGPPATLPLLKQLEPDPGTTRVPPGVPAILNNPAMWDDAVRKDPATLPILLKLAGRQDAASREIALRNLGFYGPAARPAVPALVAELGSPDASLRRTVRDALAKIDPDWKKHPALGSAIPLLLTQVGTLPKEEADELFAALGDLKPEDADTLADLVVRRLNDRNATGVPGRGRKFDPKAYAWHLETVFGPLERMGPRLKNAVPALTRKLLFQSSADLANNPHYRVLRARAVRTLEALSPDPRQMIGTLTFALGFDEEALNVVQRHGPAALPALAEALKSPNGPQRLFGIKAAAALGAVARPLLPDLIGLLHNAHVREHLDGRRDVWMLGYLVEKFNAVDRAWWGHPEAAKPFAELAAVPPFPSREAEQKRQEVLQLLAAAGPDARPLAGPLAALLLAGGGIDDEARKVLDTLDPGWRDHPGLGKGVRELVQKMNAGVDVKNERTLQSLGALAVPALVEALPGARPFVQGRMFVVLQGIGPGAREAVPALVKLAAEPKRPPESTRPLLDALRAIDPGWAAEPGQKEAAAALLAALLRRAETEPEFLGLAGKVGPPAVPELLKRLAGRKLVERQNAVIGLGEVGPGNRDAVEGLKKALKDSDAQTRRLAVGALGKVGRGDADFIPVVAPALFDPDPGVRNAAPQSLQVISPDWKKSPKLNEAVRQLQKALAAPDAKTRRTGLEVAGAIGRAEGVIPALEKLIGQEKDPENLRLARALLDQVRRSP